MIGSVPEKEPDWNFPFEGPLHEVFPALHEAQNAWLAQIDSLQAPDRKTPRTDPHGLHRHPAQSRGRAAPRHAGQEVGATWEELVGSIMLTLPGFGLLPCGGGSAVRPAGLRLGSRERDRLRAVLGGRPAREAGPMKW